MFNQRETEKVLVAKKLEEVTDSKKSRKMLSSMFSFKLPSKGLRCEELKVRGAFPELAGQVPLNPEHDAALSMGMHQWGVNKKPKSQTQGQKTHEEVLLLIML